MKVQIEAESEADAVHKLDKFVLPGNQVGMAACSVQEKKTELFTRMGWAFVVVAILKTISHVGIFGYRTPSSLEGILSYILVWMVYISGIVLLCVGRHIANNATEKL